MSIFTKSSLAIIGLSTASIIEMGAHDLLTSFPTKSKSRRRDEASSGGRGRKESRRGPSQVANLRSSYTTDQKLS